MSLDDARSRIEYANELGPDDDLKVIACALLALAEVAIELADVWLAPRFRPRPRRL